jgi:ribulose-5-phosphate 4-epimerase/fuculose-1-phosphate aldolase
MNVYRNNEARSCIHCCGVKAITITYSESVLLALVIPHAMRMRHIITCGPPRSTIFFHIISQTVRFSKKVTEQKMCFDFLYNLRPKYFSF